MGMSTGGTGEGPVGGIAAGDGSDIKGGDSGDDSNPKKKLLNIGIKAAAGALQGINQGQQPQMPAGPQVGSPVYQPQQGDAYAAYIKQLQQQQAPYGNSFYGE